jgi:hypothetical protein
MSRRRRLLLVALAVLVVPLVALAFPYCRKEAVAWRYRQRYRSYLEEQERLRSTRLGESPSREDLRAYEREHRELRERLGLPPGVGATEDTDWLRRGKTPWDGA